MADETSPNQAPGDATAAEEEGARGAGGSAGAGQSGGGAYPNPHEGKPTGGFMGHGGQTDIAYSGPEQLGEEPVAGAENPNGVTGKA